MHDAAKNAPIKIHPDKTLFIGSWRDNSVVKMFVH